MNVLLIDYHTLIRKAFRRFLESEGFKVLGDYDTVDEALRCSSGQKLDAFLVDVSPENGSISVDVGRLQAAFPRVPILFLSSRDERSSVQQAFRAGASGYLLKTASPREFLRALCVIMEGGRYLHQEVAHQVIEGFRGKREDRSIPLDVEDLQVLELVAHGYSNTRIAELNYVSVGTVKNRLRKLFRRFRVQDRMQLVVEALREGVLTLDSAQSSGLTVPVPRDSKEAPETDPV